MKNLIKISLVFTAAIMILASCNKEKAAVNKLDGSWSVKSTTVSVTGEDCSGGGTAPTTVETWAFTAYNVKDAESGAATYTYTYDTFPTVTANFTYAVDDKAETLTLTATGFSQVLTIEKLTKSELSLSMMDSVTIITDCNTFATETKMATTTVNLEKQ